jgi:hypothetical protein
VDIHDIDLKELIERETVERFNRQGYIKCPFHSEKTPSLSVRFTPDDNKERFKCFGCGTSGDAIDFIVKLRNIEYVQAREYLGLSVEKSIQELEVEKIKSYIEWEIKKFKEGQELLGIFTFTDREGKPIYFKAKFKDPKGKKNLSYYHIDGDKVVNKRGHDEVPYNLYRTLQAVRNNKVIVICEGEKDANTINSLLKGNGYEATSVKDVKDISMLEGAKVYVCGDTGSAGESYKWDIYNKLFHSTEAFKFINLPGIKDLGDNKDVTDWLEAGNTKSDLLNAFNRSLDLKSERELQQDKIGIYRIAFRGRGEEAEKYRKYLTDFRLIEAARIKYIDEDQEGVKLVLKSSTGETIERMGPSTVFDDVRTFKNFLGTLDLSVKVNADELTDLKAWINKFFALETEEVYNGVQFKVKDKEILLITNDGAIGKNNISSSIKSDGRNEICIMDKQGLTTNELREIKKHIFRFGSPEKTLSIIGTIINNLAVAQCREAKIKLHHLLIIGEAGSGKSTILECVIAPILNYPAKEIKSLGLATNFSLIKDLSDGNYSMIYEEHKPSRWDRYKISKISEVLRNLYDGSTVARGDKALKSKNFYLGRPIIIAGEESYHNNEKALIDRSCIIYTSKNERTKEHTQAMKWIMENEQLLNKLGRDLIYTVLNLSTEDYIKLRDKIKLNVEDLKDRPQNTALNAAMGIEIFNLLLKKHGIKTISNYIVHIIENIKAEVLEGGSEAHSVVEQMMTLYNDMIEDGRAFNSDEVVKYRGDGVYIKTSEMINQIKEHINKVGADITPLSLKDFKKQAIKAGYLEGVSNKLLKVGSKPVRFDTYNKDMLRKLKVDSIIPPEMLNVTDLEDNVIPFG